MARKKKTLPSEFKKLFPDISEKELLFIVNRYWLRLTLGLSKKGKPRYLRYVIPHIGTFKTNKRLHIRRAKEQAKAMKKTNEKNRRKRAFSKEKLLF